MQIVNHERDSGLRLLDLLAGHTAGAIDDEQDRLGESIGGMSLHSRTG